MTSNIGIAYPPPIPQVSIFNSQFYKYNDVPITIEEGDIRYLKKSGSTATGTIIFNAGLQTANIYNNSNTTISGNTIVLNDLVVKGNIVGIDLSNINANIVTSNVLIVNQQANITNANITGNINVAGNIIGNVVLNNLSTSNINVANIQITANAFITGNANIWSNTNPDALFKVINEKNNPQGSYQPLMKAFAYQTAGNSRISVLEAGHNQNHPFEYFSLGYKYSLTDNDPKNQLYLGMGNGTANAMTINGYGNIETIGSITCTDSNIGGTSNILTLKSNSATITTGTIDTFFSTTANISTLNVQNEIIAGNLTTNNLTINNIGIFEGANIDNMRIIGNITSVGGNVFISQTLNTSGIMYGNNRVRQLLPNGTLQPLNQSPPYYTDSIYQMQNNWGIDAQQNSSMINALYPLAGSNSRIFNSIGKTGSDVLYYGVQHGTSSSLDNYGFFGMGGIYSWTANLMTITTHGNVAIPRNAIIREGVFSNSSTCIGNSSITGNLTIGGFANIVGTITGNNNINILGNLTANVATLNNAVLNGNLLINQTGNANSNVRIYTGNDSTLFYSPSIENDVLATILARNTGNAATLGAIGSTGLYGWELLNIGTTEIGFTAQLPHTWDEGSNIIPHIHIIWGNSATNTGNANIQMRYSVLNIGEQMTGTSNISVFQPSPNIGFNSNLISFGNVSMVGKTASCIFNGTIARVAGAGDDDYGNPIYVQSIDLHYLSNKFGKDVQYTH